MRKKRVAPPPPPVARPLVAARGRVAALPTALSIARALAAVGGTLVGGVLACTRREAPSHEAVSSSASAPVSASQVATVAGTGGSDSAAASASVPMAVAAVSCSASVHVLPHVTGSPSVISSVGVIGTLEDFPNMAGGLAPVNPMPVGSGGTIGIGTLGSNTKGDDAAPTQPKIAEGSVAVGGGLDKDVVRRIVHSRFAGLRACYAKGLKKNPSLRGVVNTSFEIVAGGVVQASTSSSLGDASVDACIRGVFQTLVFPKADPSTTVAYPLLFTTTS